MKLQSALPAALLLTAAHAATPAPPALAPHASADVSTLELPVFKPGLWEYRRTVMTRPGEPPKTATQRKCGDPTHDIRQRLLDLRAKGCTFSPLTHTGNRYRLSCVCPLPEGMLQMTDSITASGDSSYQDLNQSRVEQRRTRTAIAANRVGECTLSAPAPAP